MTHTPTVVFSPTPRHASGSGIPELKAILLAPEVIAIDQDPLGKQARRPPA